ncbi:MAG TPA: hypothetical protein VFV96_05290 [Verrucomicrobiae bacterium]|nr:hypothetical protein [Verrucomicrobiae bacterium]
MAYDDYKATENSMMIVMLIGLVLVAPSVWASFTRKVADVGNEVKMAEEFNRKVRENPNQCPKCGSEEFNTHYPSKPRVWTPLNLTGVLLGTAANSMADAMFKPERVCTQCGCRWPAPRS